MSLPVTPPQTATPTREPEAPAGGGLKFLKLRRPPGPKPWRTPEERRAIAKEATRRWNKAHPNYARDRKIQSGWVPQKIRANSPEERQEARRAKKRRWWAKHKSRVSKDPNYFLPLRLRSRVAGALQRNKKAASTLSLTGMSVQDLRARFEGLFQPGMAWENYGKGKGRWHIDHIIPLALFDLSKPEEQRKAFHYTNLQPLWEEENLSKRANPDMIPMPEDVFDEEPWEKVPVLE